MTPAGDLDHIRPHPQVVAEFPPREASLIVLLADDEA
jgi:hypothetical protein